MDFVRAVGEADRCVCPADASGKIVATPGAVRIARSRTRSVMRGTTVDYRDLAARMLAAHGVHQAPPSSSSSRACSISISATQRRRQRMVPLSASVPGTPALLHAAARASSARSATPMSRMQ
jgi:hypothetical protein